MDDQTEKLIQAMTNLHTVLTVLRNDLHWNEFTFVMGNTVATYVQSQQCWIDKLHNPNTQGGPNNNGNVAVSLYDGQQLKYYNTLAPGTTEILGFRFNHDCTIVTDDLSVTIHGRIRS